MVGKKLKLDHHAPIHKNELNSKGDEIQYLSEFMRTFKYNNDLKNQLIKDLKSLNLKSWFRKSGEEVI